MKKYKSKWRAEDKASGIAHNHTEIDKALLDLNQRLDEADTARQKETAEKAGAKHAKCLTLNIWPDQKKEENDTGESLRKRSRSSTSSDSMSYFSERHEREISLRQGKLKLKKQELDLQAQRIQQHNRLSKLNSCLFSSTVQSC